MKKLLFILNPCAGKKRGAKAMAQIVNIFNRAGYTVNAYVTAGQGDATRAVRTLGAQADRIVCCGGDGTFNETVTGLLETGLQTPIGYLPAGSTNDLAASLHLPLNLEKAARICVEGSPVAYDLGKFENRYFSYVASFGAFTRASYTTPQSVKNALGHMAYVLEGIQELSQLKKIPVRFQLANGQVNEGDYLFGAISNSTSVGGILTLDPKHVDVRDGLLEVLLIRSPRDLVELAACLRALRRKNYNCPLITFLQTPEIQVSCPAGLDWTLDGELETCRGTAHIQCLPHAIQLLTEDGQ